MGTLFRLLIFILALGVVGTGTAWLMARERHREAARERLINFAADLDIEQRQVYLRAKQKEAEQDYLLFAAIAAFGLIAVAIIPARAADALIPSRNAWETGSMHREMIGLEHLARTTVAQRAELDQEREARHRSEQNLYIQQVLTTRALQDKIGLGRDLHDGLVQSLYATGLLLESAAQLIATNPAQATQILTGAKSNLKSAIKSARDVIDGLSPDALDNQNLGTSINALLDLLDGGRIEERKIVLDEDLPALGELITTELLQIIREASSNALRHGLATRLFIHFAPDAGLLRLSIRDNGCGFNPESVLRGRGLDNLTARAKSVGGLLTLTSRSGEGTCVQVSLPLPSTV